MTTSLDEANNERDQTCNRLQVLEAYFKEREEEYIKTIEQLQLKESVRDKGKEELIRIIEENENVCKDLNERLEALKEEFEETKQQHRNEIRGLEAKGHENWVCGILNQQSVFSFSGNVCIHPLLSILTET